MFVIMIMFMFMFMSMFMSMFMFMFMFIFMFMFMFMFMFRFMFMFMFMIIIMFIFMSRMQCVYKFTETSRRKVGFATLVKSKTFTIVMSVLAMITLALLFSPFHSSSFSLFLPLSPAASPLSLSLCLSPCVSPCLSTSLLFGSFSFILPVKKTFYRKTARETENDNILTHQYFPRALKEKRDVLDTGLVTAGATAAKRGQQTNGPWKPL